MYTTTTPLKNVCELREIIWQKKKAGRQRKLSSITFITYDCFDNMDLITTQ